jgi:hypothetical protein
MLSFLFFGGQVLLAYLIFDLNLLEINKARVRVTLFKGAFHYFKDALARERRVGSLFHAALAEADKFAVKLEIGFFDQLVESFIVCLDKTILSEAIALGIGLHESDCLGEEHVLAVGLA